MSKRTPTPASPFAPRDYAAALRPWLLGAAAALMAARTLVPSEAAAEKGGGAPFVMLWIGLAVVWAAAGMASGRLTIRFGWIDAAALLVAAWHAVSGWWAVQHAAPRPALNVLWEWCGMVLAYLLARQLLRTPREARAWVAVMTGLAVGLVPFAVYDRQVIQPEARARYYADPEAGLREAEVAPEQRKEFEDRLNDRSPLTTFNLTNSLAGFLAPWLVVVLGIAILEGLRRRWPTALAAAVGCAAIAVCVYWTKSRSAYVAIAAGGIVLGAAALRPWRWLRSPRAWLAAAAVAMILVAALSYAFAYEILDHDLFFGAGRSLAFRADYWRATAAMVADHPLLGVGPGNFQSRYTQYKLPQAVEEIADPHNFAFEVAATAGLPALAALLAVLGGCAWRIGRIRAEHTPDDGSAVTNPRPLPRSADALPHILAGILVGPLLAVPLSLVSGATPNLIGLSLVAVAGVAAIAALARWVRDGHLPPALLGVAAGVLLLNLLAAGGIGFTGVATSLWLLMALAMSLTESPTPGATAGSSSSAGTTVAQADRGAPRSRTLAAVIALALVPLGAACYFTAYRPTLTARGLIDRAAADPRHARELFAEATQVDPWGAEAWLKLARVELEYWKHDPRHGLGPLNRAADRALAVHPHSSTFWYEVGNMYAAADAVRPDPDVARRAADCFRRAAQLHPTLPERHARLAQALKAVGDQAGATAAEAEAQRLREGLP